MAAEPSRVLYKIPEGLQRCRKETQPVGRQGRRAQDGVRGPPSHMVRKHQNKDREDAEGQVGIGGQGPHREGEVPER